MNLLFPISSEKMKSAYDRIKSYLKQDQFFILFTCAQNHSTLGVAGMKRLKRLILSVATSTIPPFQLLLNGTK